MDLWNGFDRQVVEPGQIGVVIAADGGRRRRQSSALRSRAARRRKSKNNVPGYVRGYDVRSGRLLWTFHTDSSSAANSATTRGTDDSWQYTGNTAVWAPISADLELGYVYLPVETPTGDYYGGHRPGDNLFADSIVCLDAKTGQRIWHYQLIHHDIWDWDTAFCSRSARCDGSTENR